MSANEFDPKRGDHDSIMGPTGLQSVREETEAVLKSRDDGDTVTFPRPDGASATYDMRRQVTLPEAFISQVTKTPFTVKPGNQPK